MITTKQKPRRFSKYKKKEIIAYYHGKSPIVKDKQQERKKRTMKLQNSWKEIRWHWCHINKYSTCKWTEFITTKPALQEMLKSSRWNKKMLVTYIKTYKSTHQNNQKAQNSWMGKTNKTQLYAAYNRLTSALRTHIGANWRNRKRYST